MSDIADRVKKIVVEHLGVDADKVVESASFIDDLGADQPRYRGTGHGLRRRVRRRDSRRRGRHHPDRRRRDKVHREVAGLTISKSGSVPFVAGTGPAGQCCRCFQVISVSCTGNTDETRRHHWIGHALAARLRRRDHLVTSCRGQECGAPRSPTSRSRTCLPRSPAAFPSATAPTAPTIRTTGWSRRSSARSIRSSVYAMAAADQALADAGWAPKTEEDQCRTGVLIGSGIGGLDGIVEAGYTLRDRGPRRISPVLHPRAADQSRLGPGIDPARTARAEPFRRHGLLHRRPCHRRRQPADRPRRRRRDGRRRNGIADLPHRARRFRRLQGAVGQPQRRPAECVEAL